MLECTVGLSFDHDNSRDKILYMPKCGGMYFLDKMPVYDVGPTHLIFVTVKERRRI